MTAERPALNELTIARRAMIDSQLRVSGVAEDFVLAAMNRVAREDFVPPAARGHAYIDRAIPLGNGRALPAPLFHGRLLVEAAPAKDDKVLLVSCGSGYLTALVQPLVATLDVVDAADVAAIKAKRGGYTLLLIDGAIEHLPDTLAGQLVEGGRVVAGLVTRGVTRLASGRKLGGQLALQSLAEIGIPVLRDFPAPKRWSF